MRPNPRQLVESFPDMRSGVPTKQGLGHPRGPAPELPLNNRSTSVARVVVNVMPKTEILDPQGQAVHRALGRIGVSGVSDVRQGKRFELEVDDSVSDEDLKRLAETLLANTVIEDFEVVRGEGK